MSRLVGSVVILGLAAGIASAQPGAPQPYPPQPYAPQPYAPQPYAPPAYGYRPAVQLTAEEAQILQQGPISDGAHLGGGLLALFLGFGSGQAAQGRWGDTGWIFTVGDVASSALMIYGMTSYFANCFEYDEYGRESCNNGQAAGALIVGALAYTGFRIWETVDAFAGPAAHNRRYRELQMRVNGYAPQPQWGLYVSPSLDKHASVAGVSLTF